MPEPIATLWVVLVGSGGYVLGVVTFFKDFLNVRKLELEIAKLRSDVEDKNKRVVLATPIDIEKYGRPRESSTRSRVSAQVLGVAAIGIGIAVLLPLLSERSTNTPTPPSQQGTGHSVTIEERLAAAALIQAMNPPDVSTIPTKDLEQYLVAAELGKTYIDKARVANDEFIADLKQLLEQRKAAERAASTPK
jgi:hypothetical protein